MTTTTDFLTALRTEWRRTGATPEAQRAAREFALRHAALDIGLEYASDLVDVVHLLESRGPRRVLERAALIQALLEDAGDPLIHRALLQALLPGIVSVCRQLRFGSGIIDDPAETVAVAITLAGELLRSWAGQSRQYAAPDILSALRGRLRRYLLKEKSLRSRCAPLVGDQADGAEESLATRLEVLAGCGYERLARLTYARVFEGTPWSELARRDVSTPARLQHELQNFAVHHLF